MKKLLLLSLTMLLPLLVNADAVEINGIYYNLITKAKQAEVKSNSNEATGENQYTGEIIIPDSVEYEGAYYKVTSIADGAFSRCSGLTAISFPSSITSIGEHAFYQCSGLKSVYIDDLVAWCKIKFANNESSPFASAEHLYINGEEIKDLIIPSDVTSIEDNAFNNCACLTSLVISDGVTNIGNDAFRWCTGITSVIMANSVTSIGVNSFMNCQRLESLELSNNLSYISSYAFCGCNSLTSVVIPNSVKGISLCAFMSCALTSVTIGEGVTEIGRNAFQSCPLKSVVIPNSVNRIRDEAFMGCGQLVTITMGNGINSIQQSAFADCPEITDVYCHATSVPATSSNAFEGSYAEAITLHVPEAALENYKATAPWSGFKEVVAISPSGISKLEASETSVKCEGDQLTVEGINDGQAVELYSLNGEKRGSAVGKNGAARIDTNVRPGSIVVVKMGEKSVKVIVK